MQPYTLYSVSGVDFTNIISIPLSFHLRTFSMFMGILIQWLLQNFAHATTAVLSSHVQKFVAISWSGTVLLQNKFQSNLNCKWKKWNGPQAHKMQNKQQFSLIKLTSHPCIYLKNLILIFRSTLCRQHFRICVSSKKKNIWLKYH